MTIDQALKELQSLTDNTGEIYEVEARAFLRRFALEFVTSCLPVEMKMTLVRGTVDPDDYYRDEYYVDGFNYCRLATLEAAKRILGI